MVTYGAMSQQPLSVPPGLLIFNDVRLRGFWLTGGYAKARRAAALRALQLRSCAASWRSAAVLPGSCYPHVHVLRSHARCARSPSPPGGCQRCKLLTLLAGALAPSPPVCLPPRPQMKDGWRAKEQLVDHVCALFRTKVIKPCP